MTNLPPESEKGEIKYKAIVFKLPFDLQERILSFPLIHAFHDRYPDSEFHFITPKKNIEVLNLLPFHAFYHEFDEDEIQTVFDVHRYAVTSKIYEVDLYISLTNSFADAALGVALKAKERLGFSDGWKTLLFNQKVKRPVGHHICEDFFELYRTHINSNVEMKLKVMSRDLTPKYSDWQDHYIAINLSPLRGALIEDEWYELVSKFENQRFIFFASDDQVKFHTIIDQFMNKLPKGNRYEVMLVDSWIDLAKMLAFARGVITYDGPMASFSAYLGAKTIALYEMEDPQRYGPFYFMADVITLNGNDPTVTLAQAPVPVGAMKGRIRFSMTEVARRAFDFFRLDTNLPGKPKD